MNEAIELHDSVLERVTETADGVVIRLTAYVHRSQGIPGHDSGTGWSQPADITVHHGRVTAQTATPPCCLDGGTVNGEFGRIENVLPLPFRMSGPSQVQLDGLGGEVLVVKGANVEVTMLDKPDLLDEYEG
jgi:hypothetical protein